MTGSSIAISSTPLFEAGDGPLAPERVTDLGETDETFMYRANAYLQIGPFHEVIYGQETDQPEFVRSGLEGIRARIVRAFKA